MKLHGNNINNVNNEYVEFKTFTFVSHPRVEPCLYRQHESLSLWTTVTNDDRQF